MAPGRAGGQKHVEDEAVPLHIQMKMKDVQVSCSHSGSYTCVQAHERLEEVKLQAVRSDNVQLVQDVLESLKSLQGEDEAVGELAKILQEPHFKVRLTRLQRKPGPWLQTLCRLILEIASEIPQADPPPHTQPLPPRHVPLLLPSDELRPGVRGWGGGMCFLWPIAAAELWGAASHLVLCEFLRWLCAHAAAAGLVRN